MQIQKHSWRSTRTHPPHTHTHCSAAPCLRVTTATRRQQQLCVPAAAAGASSSGPQGGENSSSLWQRVRQHPLLHKLLTRLPEVAKAAQEQVLLFVAVGMAAAFALFSWAKGNNVYRNKPYSFCVTFPEAEGIEQGVALRLKGVRVGEVQAVAVDMEKGVSAQVEVFLGQTLIPKHPKVKIEYNRTGMMSPEPFIDVTVPSVASPYAVRTRSRRDVNQQKQQQQQQGSEGSVSAGDAALAVSAAASTSQDVDLSAGGDMSSDCTQFGSDLSEDASSAMDEGYSQRGRAGSRAPSLAEASPSSSSPKDPPPSNDTAKQQPASSTTPFSSAVFEGSYIQQGDVIEGSIGGSTDILTRMTVKNNRGPPGSGKVQLYR